MPKPAAPTNLSATILGSEGNVQVQLNWTDNATDETIQNVVRDVNGTITAPYASVGANVTTFTDTGSLPTSGTVRYRVRAGNASGWSGYSNIVTVTHPFVAPQAPTSLSAAKVSGSSTVQLNWTNTSTIETSIQVSKDVNGTETDPYAVLGANAVSFLDTGSMPPSGTVTYAVRACNSVGCSADSAPAAVVF